MPYRTLAYEDILKINQWCQEIVVVSIIPTYGIRDDNLLRSIPKSLIQSFDGIEFYPTIYDKCTYLWYSLSQYHCFADGNKRTALVTTVVLLMLNGFAFETSAYNLYNVCIDLASSKLSIDAICKYLVSHTKTIDEKAVAYSDYIDDILNYLSGDLAFIDILEKLGH